MSRAAAAARNYAAMWMEPDRARRRALLDECFAADGRLVARNATLRGRDAVSDAMDAFFADPRGLRTRLDSEIDANDTSFRFRAVLELPDGVILEVHDIGEIDD